MRCKALTCMNNIDGCCSCDSYVTIQEDGTCSEWYPDPDREEEEDE